MTDQPEPGPCLSRIRQAWANTDDAAARFASLDMDPDRLGRIIDGEQRPTSLDLALIAEACRTTVDWLIGGKPPREPFPRPDADHAYRDAVNAPLSDRDVRALNARLASGDVPSRVVHHRYTAAPLDPDRERAATERAVQKAAESERADAWLLAQQKATARTTPDNPAASSDEADNGLRKQYVAAMIDAGFGEQDAADIATTVLAVGDRRMEQLREQLRDKEAARQAALNVIKLQNEREERSQAAIARVRAVAEQFTHTGQQSGAVIAFDEAAACILTALDGPTDTTPTPEAQPTAPRCPRCGDSLADYTDDDLVYRTGDERPYCSGECVVRAHRAALKDQPDGDTCRPVQVDGDTIRVHGAREMTEQEVGYLGEVVAAAKRKLAAEPPVVPDDDGTESELTRRIRVQQRGEPEPAGEQHTGLVVEPYRTDAGRPAWVFRCWGTDTCDGWLSLDHSTQSSAESARDRHVADEHGVEAGPIEAQPEGDPCFACGEPLIPGPHMSEHIAAHAAANAKEHQ